MKTTIVKKGQTFYALAAFFLFYGCTAPRTITQSGKVTPHKQVKGGMDYSVSVPTHFVKSLYKNVEGIVIPLANKDSVYLDEQLIGLNKTVLAYSIDPLGFGYNYYARYGIAKRVDIGYKYASGTHVFDGMYQFMGSTGTIDNPGEKQFFGSIGIQYSAKKYDLPSWSGLDKVQNVLGYEMKRKDILIPLVFSIPFGKEEEFGNFSFGVAYAHSFLNYGFRNNNIYIDTLSSSTPDVVQAFQGKKNYSSFGTFFNFKCGYRFIYFVPALSVYYQNYGKFKLIDGGEVNFKGLTFVPSIGVQINPSEIALGIKRIKSKKAAKTATAYLN